MLKDSFLKYLRFERNYSPHTVAAYGKDISEFEEYFAGIDEGLDFCAVDADVVRGWMLSLMEQRYTATSVNRKLSSLRTFYRYLLREGKVKADPCARVNGPKKKKPLPVFVREEDMNRLLDETDFASSYEGVRDRMILELFYATGIRLSELIGLETADVDLSAKTIKVTGKRNKQRIVPFGEELEQDLRLYLEARETVGGDNRALFLGKEGQAVRRGTVYRIVKTNLSKVVTLKKRSPHVLRHSFATAMLNNGAELDAVKELLGHASLAATQVYTHTTFEELKKVYEQAHPRA